MLSYRVTSVIVAGLSLRPTRMPKQTRCIRGGRLKKRNLCCNSMQKTRTWEGPLVGARIAWKCYFSHTNANGLGVFECPALLLH